MSLYNPPPRAGFVPTLRATDETREHMHGLSPPRLAVGGDSKRLHIRRSGPKSDPQFQVSAPPDPRHPVGQIGRGGATTQAAPNRSARPRPAAPTQAGRTWLQPIGTLGRKSQALAGYPGARLLGTDEGDGSSGEANGCQPPSKRPRHFPVHRWSIVERPESRYRR